MKRAAAILAVAAAMGVLAPSAVAATGRSGGLPVVKPALSDLSLHTANNDRSGQTMYRLGDTGLWME